MRPGISYLPFEQTGQLNKLVLDYLNEIAFLDSFHNGKPDLENLLKAVNRRKISQVNRKLLSETLLAQYAAAGIDDAEINRQISSLENENTFTVTTGQQTGIFLGPAYTLMKILTTIRLAELLNEQDPDHHYVPVFWMATEDHDLEEIRHHWFRNQKYSWNTTQTGPVGRFKTDGIGVLINQMLLNAGKEPTLIRLFETFGEAYAAGSISQATRKLVHSLFGHLNLLVIDPDDRGLKTAFMDLAKRDILEGNSHRIVDATTKQFAGQYSIQVNPRPVNFFWMEDAIRTRIERAGSGYKTAEDQKNWTESALLEDLERNPECFSPNVLMRPLYQESILPNIAYIGGAAEISYWLELKPLFDHYAIPFPAVILRNSLTLIDKLSSERINRYDLLEPDLFLSRADLLKKVIHKRFGDLFFQEREIESLNPFFENLERKAGQIATSKVSALKAMQKRWEHDLQNFNRKLIRYKQKLESELVSGLDQVHDCVFPAGTLQERRSGLPDLVYTAGGDIFTVLQTAVKPLQPEQIIIRL